MTPSEISLISDENKTALLLELRRYKSAREADTRHYSGFRTGYTRDEKLGAVAGLIECLSAGKLVWTFSKRQMGAIKQGALFLILKPYFNAQPNKMSFSAWLFGIAGILGVDSLVSHRPLGSGTFGTVLKGSFKDIPGKQCALKVFPDCWDYLQEKYVLDALKEAKCAHPNLIQYCFRGEFMVTGVLKYVIGLPLYEISLWDLMGSNRLKKAQFQKKKRLSVYLGLAEGVEYLHSLGWLHRDIKSANVLLNTAMNIAVLADFGAAILTSEATEGGFVSTTRMYCDPAVSLHSAKSTTKSDVYGLAKTGIEMITLDRSIFKNNAAVQKMDDAALADENKQACHGALKDAGYSPGVVSLFFKATACNREIRSTMSELIGALSTEVNAKK